MRNLQAEEFSRIQATAQTFGIAAPDAHRFTQKKVLLTGDIQVLSTPNGRRCLLDSLLLLMRMVRNLTVALPDVMELQKEVEIVAKSVAYGIAPTFLNRRDVNLDEFDAILSIGFAGEKDLPWTVVNSNGWSVRVASLGRSLSSECSCSNPVGALAAACLGVAEVFKRLIKLRPEKGAVHDELLFSFHSYSLNDDPGPSIVEGLIVDVLLAGAGAIGNGTLHLLKSLPISGRIIIVDNQTYGLENWGTCLLIGPQEFGVPKALVAQKWMQGKLEARGFHEKVEEFRSRCGKEIDYPKLIVNGLDKISARRAVQDLWPDQIIDGAIGPTSCEVTQHPWGPSLSCLKCDFEELTRPASVVQQQSTGLKPDRLSNQFSLISWEDIENAPPDKRKWLKEREGRQICSVVSEATVALLSEEEQGKGFEPSVPFVACLSSCMIITELVRYIQRSKPVLEPDTNLMSWSDRNVVFKSRMNEKQTANA